MEIERIRLKIYFVIFFTLLLLGIFGFMFIENLSLVDAAYFSIVTMATVGYGDIHPQSLLGKILAIVLIVGGVGTFLGIVSSTTDLLLKRRQELLRHQKLNMVTGLFFSELGNGLLRRFAHLDSDKETLHMILKITNQWGEDDFITAINRLQKYNYVIDSHRGDLSGLREFLQKQASLLLRLLENPIVHEHETFSDLLKAIFHLRDELMNRSELSNLVDTDRAHLDGDIVRIYKLLVIEWVRYMSYLKNNYGYLFSLAIRINPFDSEASAVVKNS
ncbi:potassium channel family protein [Thermodesulfobacteriota bacterium]